MFKSSGRHLSHLLCHQRLASLQGSLSLPRPVESPFLLLFCSSQFFSILLSSPPLPTSKVLQRWLAPPVTLLVTPSLCYSHPHHCPSQRHLRTQQETPAVTSLDVLPLAATVCSWKAAFGPELPCSCPCPLGSVLDVSWLLLAG